MKNPIPTLAGDNVLRIPPTVSSDDDALLLDISRKVVDIITSASALEGAERDATIQGALKELEAGYART